MPIEAVLFDLDDTLIVDEAVSRETFAEVCEYAASKREVDAAKLKEAAEWLAQSFFEKGPAYAYCKEIGISAFECMWGTFLGEDDRLEPLHEWSIPFRRNVWKHALAECDVIDERWADELAHEWAERRRKNVREMPYAMPLLTELDEHYKVGLLTNGSPSLQRDKIAIAALEPCLDAIAISGEVRIGKPQPGIFDWLCEQLGVSKDRSVMVGNSLGRDIKGAQNAGMRSVWIHVPGAEGGDPKEIQADETIKSLDELPAVLERMKG